MKYLIPILLLFAAPALAQEPTPSPTPEREEISDYRVPLGSAIGYGIQDGELLRIRVDEDGRLIVDED